MRWLRNALRRSRLERDIGRELQFHLDQHVEDLVARGVPEAEARRRARIELGGVPRIREEMRAARALQWLDTLSRDGRDARRVLSKTPGFSVTIVAMLAIAIGVAAAIFALVDAVLIRPLPFAESDRLVAIHHDASGVDLPWHGVSTGTYLHYRAGNRVFEDLGLYFERIDTLTDLAEPEQVHAAFVSPSVFSTLRAQPFLGRFPTNADTEVAPSGLFLRAAVVISHDLWTRRFGGSPDIIGRPIRFGNVPGLHIVGVAAPGFHFPRPDTQVWIAFPPEMRENRLRASLRGLSNNAVARLKPGVPVDEARADLNRLVRSIPDAFPDVTAAQFDQMGLRADVTPLKDDVVGDVRVPLLMLLTTAALLLMITWANAANLSLVRAERLRREVAVARALGAGTRHLIHRFLAESSVLAAIAASLASIVASAAVDLRFGFAPTEIPRLGEVAFDGRVWGIIGGLAAASALLLALTAFFSVNRPHVFVALTGSLTRIISSRRDRAWRRALVTAQVALTLPLLIGAALMAKSIWKLSHVDLGFDPSGVFTFTLPVPPARDQSGDFYRGVARIHASVLQHVRALPGVQSAEAVTLFPLTPGSGYDNLRIAPSGRPDAWTYTSLSYATPGYFAAMKIPMLRGRTFETADLNDRAPGVIVSVRLARTLFDTVDAVGRRVQWPKGSDLRDDGTPFAPYVIVGVVGDVATDTLQEGPTPILYFPHVYPPPIPAVTFVVSNYIPDRQVYTVRTTLPLATLAPAVRRIVREVDATLAVTRFGTVQQRVDDSMARTRLTMLLLIVAAVTALFIGMVGVHAVLAYTSAQRIPEFGIRLALGADPRTIVSMVLRQGLAVVAIGIVVGLAGASGLTRFLRGVLYDVAPLDPAVFAAMAALVAAVALAACYVPARRAGRVDPVQALKAE